MTVDFGIGISDFAEIINSKFTYLDKSLLIKELLEDGSKVILFPRPRRFGKTLNMTMLRCFLDVRDIKKNKDLFKDLKVSQYPEILKHQGIYPVIYLSLKEIKKNNYKSVLAAIGILIQSLFTSYEDLKADVPEGQRPYFERLLSATASEEELVQSLKFLSMILEKKYDQKVWVLIDEYDTPIHAAWESNYYDEMKSFMQGFLGAGLKDNTAVYKSILTGILRISKEGMFSDLNNVMVYSMLSDFYGSYFGFTEAEVDWICEEADVSGQREQVRSWYNGYKFGNLNIYNPWSIINFAKNKKLGPYWVNTGSSQLIEDLISQAGPELKKDFEILIQGGVIKKPIDEKITLPKINAHAENAIWSFLLFAGYLKIVRIDHESELGECEIALPNIEIMRVYQRYFLNWFESIYPAQSNLMLKALITGDIENFEELFTDYVAKSLSYFDVEEGKAESFYHALVLGMIVALRDSHQILSNRESGLGRYDLMIIPKDLSKLGVILEFKSVKKEELLEAGAEMALAQINNKNYEAELEARGIKKILKLAIVFYGKKVLIKT